MSRGLTARERKIFFVCAAAVLLSIFYNSVIVPLRLRDESVDRGIRVEQAQLDRDLRTIHKAKTLDVSYDVYLSQFRQPGTGEETVTSMLAEIETAAGGVGLHVADLKPQKVKEGEFERQFFVGLTINGEFARIVRFLYILQQKPRLFDVQEVQFERSAGRNQNTMTTRLVLGKAFIP
jgi:Tfp pilus assembly protein PilO